MPRTQSITEGSQNKNSSRNWSRSCGGMLFSCLLLSSCWTSFSIWPRTSCLGQVGWAFPHQSTSPSLTGPWFGQSLNCGFLSQVTLVCVWLTVKTKQGAHRHGKCRLCSNSFFSAVERLQPYSRVRGFFFFSFYVLIIFLPFLLFFQFLIENNIFHTIYSDHGFLSPNAFA